MKALKSNFNVAAIFRVGLIMTFAIFSFCLTSCKQDEEEDKITDSSVVQETTSQTVADTISRLSGDGTFTVKVTGAIDSSTISSIASALKKSRDVSLDLSETTGLTSIEERAFEACSNLVGITFPSSVTTIGKMAFYGTRLQSISLPSTVKTIGEEAFSSTESASIVVDGSESIGESAFYYNQKVTSVKIESGTKTIGDYAFFICPLLNSVYLPTTLETIGSYAFSRCDSLKEINFAGTLAQWEAISKGSDLGSSDVVVHCTDSDVQLVIFE